ncbi:hypothetical protein Clole_0498 [Cellulosilyticum lentocellum DSM 5427]|uniref:Uncharacterized protein n=1 Tax=Cellulosilyticum lentocellum (strain ATCC 49066 / DSM 5427 / NCIMB 11756 / RHM5) TaxID=642492 RepID=F2JLE9_CELLD|nr:hypothetical protein Clole_0498 [Cellulosilyticum lentocellum DSM 5427]
MSDIWKVLRGESQKMKKKYNVATVYILICQNVKIVFM